MNKKIITIVLVVLGFAGLVWWGRISQLKEIIPESGSASMLTASENSYDFGEISMKKGLVDYTFKITNRTEKEIEIKKVYTSCMCTAAYLENDKIKKGPFGMEGMGYIPPANEILESGETVNVKVVYDPNAHGPAGVGAIDRFVHLVDSVGGDLQLEIKAVVTP